MPTPWRMAIMFDRPGDDLNRFQADIRTAHRAFVRAAGDRPLRIGVAILPSGVEEAVSQDVSGWRSVDGAIEVTFATDYQGAAPLVCDQLRPMLADLAADGSIEVTMGRLYPMAPAVAGSLFLSLAFRRYPGTTVDQFRDWWFNQHAPIAIPVLGPDLLAYDQVHVDEQMTKLCADALGVTFVEYDAYDNLTWDNARSYARSIGNAAAMVTIADDEVGRIDNTTRRFALMQDIRQSR